MIGITIRESDTAKGATLGVFMVDAVPREGELVILGGARWWVQLVAHEPESQITALIVSKDPKR